MNEQTVKYLSLTGVIILLVNFLLNLLGTNYLISPFGYSSVMTIFTSASLLAIYLSIIIQKTSLKYLLWSFSFAAQCISLLLFNIENKPSWSYLVNSSVTTSVFITILIIFMIILQRKENKVNIYLGPILFLICITLLYCFISEKFYFLGISQEYIGIGLSPYTLLSFFLVSISLAIRHTKIVSLKNININLRPLLILVTLLTYSFMSFLLLFYNGKSQIISTIVVHTIFLGISYFTIFRPFLNSNDKYITVCAWSKKIKTGQGVWIHQEELFKSLGINSTHGICPEEADKARKKSK